MLPAEERGVRRAVALMELLRHPNLARCMGHWEAEDAIYIGALSHMCGRISHHTS